MNPQNRSQFSVCIAITIAVALSTFCVGCRYRPNFRDPPGTVYHQRNQAVLHDPFPADDAGPPIQGGRPMGFDVPLSEIKKRETNPYARRGARGF